MCAKTSIYKVIFLSLLLSGCANSMYFYETEKISLTVDARPDPSQPVQGNLGIKQRVALIVPKKSNDDANDEVVPKKGTGDGAIPKKINDDTDDGEALASISSFNFRIIKKDWALNPILVQTAFVTGDAAVKLYEKNDSLLVARVAEAITIESNQLPPLKSYATCIAKKIKSDQPKFAKLKEVVNKNDFKELSNNEWEEFAPDLKDCSVPSRLSFTDSLRMEVQKEMNK